jgi:hypothetical protein
MNVADFEENFEIFPKFLNYRVYMKYWMCEFIVKSKNNFKISRPRRDQFKVTL